MGYGGSGHDETEQHGSEGGQAGEDEQDRAQHFEHAGDVSEPLTDADCVEESDRFRSTHELP